MHPCIKYMATWVKCWAWAAARAASNKCSTKKCYHNNDCYRCCAAQSVKLYTIILQHAGLVKVEIVRFKAIISQNDFFNFQSASFVTYF